MQRHLQILITNNNELTFICFSLIVKQFLQAETFYSALQLVLSLKRVIILGNPNLQRNII